MPGGDVTMQAIDRSRLRFDAATVDRILCGIGIFLFAFAAIRLLDALGLWSNSDAAVPVLLADEILRKGSFFPGTWYYANGEIWTLAPQVLALPFVLVLGVATLALKLANATALLLAVGCVALVVRTIARSWVFALIVALGVLAPVSTHHVGVVYVQAAYGMVLAQLALLTYLSLRILDRIEERASPGNWIWIGYAALLVQFAVGSPLRVLVYWMIPLSVACVATLRFWQRRDIVRLLVVSAAILVLGAALHEWMQAHLLVKPGASASGPQPIEYWPQTAHRLWQLARGFSDYGPLQPFWSAPASAAFRWLRMTAFVLALAAPILIVRPSRADSPKSVFFTVLSIAMFGVVLAVLVVIGRPVGRYLLPPLLMCLAALLTTLRLRLSAHALAYSVATGIFVIAFLGGAFFRSLSLPRVARDSACDAPALACNLRTALAQRGLHKGYATYWNANVTTLASNGDIRVCGFSAATHAKPFRWLVSKDCFDPPSTHDRYFVAFRREEVARIDRDAYIADLGRPDSIANTPDYEIWIYEPGPHRTDWLER